MSTSKSNVVRFIPKEQKRTKTDSPPQDFNTCMQYHPDMNIAANLVAEQARLNFDYTHKGEIEQLELEQESVNKDFHASRKILDALEKKKSNTKPFIKSSDEAIETPFRDWKAKDKITIIFLIPMLLIAMVMGASNVYANLIASGVIIFIQQTGITLALSLLLPTGSLAIKFVANFIENDLWRRRYSFSIYVLTFIALMIWSVLFALNFNGVSGGIDWEQLGEADSTGSALVWSQLLLEILMTSALALAIEDIYLKYSPDAFTTNMEYVAINNAQKAQQHEHKALRDKRNQIHSRLIELKALRQARINEQLAQFISLRTRINRANHPNF